MRKKAGLLAIAFAATCLLSAHGATIGASGDTSMPSQLSTYTLGTPINETIAFDPGKGPWLKDLVNGGGSGIGSGVDVLISEVLLNGGQASWTDWHEQVVSRTTINQPDDSPGFLFRSNSVSVKADYGSGFITLSEGPDYTLVATPYSGPNFPPPNNNGNWEALSIFFAPGREIGPGQSLRIEEDLFEVFGDGNPWRPDEAARIGQFPSAVPEPAGFSLCALGLSAFLFRRRRALQAV